MTTAILNHLTPVGHSLPPVSRRLSPELNRVVGETGNEVQTLHNDPEAAAREGLREPIAVASRPAALIYRMMLMCFGEGWIVGGKGSLTYRRPVGIRDFVTAKVERAVSGFLAIALGCDVGRRAGQQDAVEPRGDFGGAHQVWQRRDDQRGDIGVDHRRADIALHHRLRRFDPDGAVAGDHAKDGAGGHSPSSIAQPGCRRASASTPCRPR